MADIEPPSLPARSRGSRTPKILSATLRCDNCGEATPHRVLRLDPARRGGTGVVHGTARCQICQWTHRFDSAAAGTVDIACIVSVGQVSERSRITLPAHRQLQVGSGIPDSPEPVRILRIDTRDGRRVPAALTDAIATIWVVRDVGAIVPVSIVEGRRTRTARLIVPRETPYEVGGRVTVEGTRLDIVALRARGHTWRRPGDAFEAAEVQRIYGRRIEIPPAGRSDWSSGRGTLRSFASSTSSFDRSRSSPGVRRTRTTPRARTAEGGATVHRSSRS